MKRFLFPFLMALTIGVSSAALAQTAPPRPGTVPGAAPGTPPSTGVDPTGAPTTTVPPRPTSTSPARPTSAGRPDSMTFSRLEGSCLEEGGILRLLGRGFTASRREGFEIRLKPDDEILPVLSVRDHLITTRLRNGISLDPAKKYQVELKLGGRVIPGAGQDMRLSPCTESAVIPDEKVSDLDGQDYMPGEILVLLPFSAFPAEGISKIRDDLKAGGYALLEDTPLDLLESHLLRLKAPEDQDLLTLIQNLRSAYPNAIIDFNHISRLASGARQYGAKLSALPTPPSTCKELSKVQTRIGIVDGAPNMGHTALQKSENIHMARFGDGPPSPPLASAHGTAITAQFKGDDPELELYGLIPDARVFVADALGSDNGIGNSSSLLKSFNWLIKRKSEIISISMEGPDNRLIASTIQKLNDLGIFVVAAAGNGGLVGHPVYPAAYPSVISVTAVGPTRGLYNRANQGDFIDFAAPGVGIWLARLENGASYQSGTSFAVPYVVAKAAVILTSHPARNNLSPDTLRDLLAGHVIDLGPEGPDQSFGRGLLQFENCL